MALTFLGSFRSTVILLCSLYSILVESKREIISQLANFHPFVAVASRSISVAEIMFLPTVPSPSMWRIKFCMPVKSVCAVFLLTITLGLGGSNSHNSLTGVTITDPFGAFACHLPCSSVSTAPRLWRSFLNSNLTPSMPLPSKSLTVPDIPYSFLLPPPIHPTNNNEISNKTRPFLP